MPVCMSLKQTITILNHQISQIFIDFFNHKLQLPDITHPTYTIHEHIYHNMEVKLSY